jgi:hypothetical protein
MSRTYLEARVDLLVSWIRSEIPQEGAPPDLVQEITLEALDLIGRVMDRRDRALLSKTGDILSVWPTLRGYAEGVFLEKLRRMEDVLLTLNAEIENENRPTGAR